VLLFGRWISVFAEKPAVAFHWGAIGGYYEAFSSSYIRRVPLHTTPVSGGADNVKNPVEVARKPPTISAAFDKLYEAKLLQEVKVPLDGAHGAAQGFGQGLHLGPAQARLVVGVVRERTICRNRLGRDTGEDEVLDFGDTGELGLVWHCRLLGLVRRCALMIEFTKAAVLG